MSASGGGDGGVAEVQTLHRSTGGVEVANAGAAAAAASDDDDEVENPCPICLDNKDDAYVDGKGGGMCTACGQSYCGSCNTTEKIGQVTACPTCRAPLRPSREEDFKRCWKLVHDRSPGRHTPAAQNKLGAMYQDGQGVKQNYEEAIKWRRRSAEQGCASAQHNLGNMCNHGKGVKQDYAAAMKWYRCAAEQGHASAQNNLGTMYDIGQGVKQDYTTAIKWYTRAAEQGFEDALGNLNSMQQHNLIPTPPPGTTITTVLLTSAAASKYNNKKGTVVVPLKGQPAVKVGRAAVLLEGEANPISFKLMNLRLG